MWEILDEYEKKFDDIFPLYMMQNATEEEIIAEAKKCIETGKPYSGDKKGAIY